MNLNSNWHCSICSQENSVDSINETINECFDILYSSKWTLEDCEILLPQLLQKLHPNHNIGKVLYVLGPFTNQVSGNSQSTFINRGAMICQSY